MSGRVKESISSRPSASTGPQKYKPPSVKLSYSVKDVLKKYEGKETPSSAQVLKELQEKEPNWALTDRRVKKFMNRHLKGHSNPAGADDDATIQSSGVRGYLKSFFTIKAATPAKPVHKVDPSKKEQAPPKAVTKAAPVKEEKKPEPVPEEVNESVEVSEEKAAAYQDDNTGKKFDCELPCVIM